MRLKKIRKFIHDLDQFLCNTLIKGRVYEIDLKIVLMNLEIVLETTITSFHKP